MIVQDWLGKDNQLGIDIWTKKYQRNNETFDEWVKRVSGGDKEVAKLIMEKKFLFGGRILSNRGVTTDEEKTTYSNCYVISPPEDSIESIYDTCKKLARTYSYGGGCGIDISKLAPMGAKVHNQAKSTSGAVSFMDTFSQVTEQIGQNGRRGALMVSIACDHPDIEEFIDIKKDLSRVTKANISVRVTDEFMKAVEDDADWELSYTREETSETISKTVKAKDLMMKLAYNNWDMGEPGILFWDRIKHWNLLSEFEEFEYAGVNPCAEEPLPAGGSCLLGSINLAAYVTEDCEFDFDSFKEDVHVITKAMNDVLDEGLALHPLSEQRESVADWRQIGIGVMGIADMLIKMELSYGSVAARELCDEIAFVLLNHAMMSSSFLALLKGKAFKKYDFNKIYKSDFFKHNTSFGTQSKIEESGLYNSQLLTIAPTGTLSTMLGISGGIEPIYANYYERKTESLHGEDVYYKVYTPIVKEYMEEHGLTDDSQLPEWFVTSKDITPSDRIKMQGVWQQYIDASISSTINLPESATPEDVMNIYMEAWRAGLKGITVFRSGCRRAAILSTDSHKETVVEAPATSETLPRGYIIDTSDGLVGKKRKLTTGCGSLHITAFFDPDTGDLMETYLSKGSTGGCANSLTGLSRMISLAARAGVDIQSIVDQLDSCGVCPSYAVRRATKKDTSKGSCCPMAVGNALLDMWKEMQDEVEDSAEDNVEDNTFSNEKCEETHTSTKEKCPQCGEPIVHEGGCTSCKSCGWSKCDL